MDGSLYHTPHLLNCYSNKYPQLVSTGRSYFSRKVCAERRAEAQNYRRGLGCSPAFVVLSLMHGVYVETLPVTNNFYMKLAYKQQYGAFLGINSFQPAIFLARKISISAV